MKTPKKLLLTVMLLLMVCGAMAQNNKQDVVYLKNGSIIRGSIIEFIPDKYVKIEIIGGNVFVYQIGEIEKCVKETPINVNRNETSVPSEEVVGKDTSGIKRGYYGVFEMGTGFSGGYMEGPLRTRIHIINGYRINPWIALGMGFGFRAYPGDDLFMPLFVDIRTNFLNKKTSPYVSLDAGYGFNLDDVNRGGPMISPTLGVSVKLKKRFAINLGLSYEWQRSKTSYYLYDYIYPAYYYPSPTRESTHTISFQFGISF